MKLITKLPFVLSLVIVSGLLLSSCGDGDDPVTEASKEKFIGDYVGTVSCAGLLAAVIDESETLSFTIENTNPETDDMVKVNLPIPGFQLELEGTVSGNTVAMDETTVEDIEALGQKIDVTASGNATLTGNSLAGTMDLTGFTKSGAQLGSDKCTITANKQ